MVPARNIAIVCLAAAAIAAGSVSPAGDWLRGLSLDTLLPLRHALFGRQAPPSASHVAVIAIDEETYRRPPFADTPQAAWPPLLAPVVAAVAEPARAVGFDVVYSTTLEGFQRGFERDFLVALRNTARAGKLVLGKVQHSDAPILPHRAQQIAAGGNDNIRALNVFEDPDGIIRRVPLVFAAAGGEERGFAAELASRAAGTPLGRGEDGGLRLGSRRPATDRHGNLALNFNTGAGAVPTHSLADLQACIAAGRAEEYLQRHFAGKIVIFATVLDVEDRRLTSMRLATSPDAANAPPRCLLPPLPLHRAGLARDSIPGVYIHATAINNLLDGSELRDLSGPATFAAAALLAIAMGLAAFLLPIGGAVALGAAAVLALPVAGAALLAAAWTLPWLNLAAAMVLTLGVTVAFRFAVTDRDKRLIARLFSLYLPSAVIDRMMQAGRTPALGGEERDVTVLFSDIAGFTAISEACDPATLVEGLNTYFSAMTGIIEEHGGFVDKYIGDAIVAVFGAPADDPRHAEHALRAAIAMRDLLRREPARFAVAGLPFRTRIGLNSGPVLIGNIGSPRRFNYTVIGDTVNLASRLEGANKKYGTDILASESTVAAGGPGIVSRAIDRVRVVGREQPVQLFEPLASLSEAGAEAAALATAFAAAQAALQQRDIAGARRALQDLTATDTAAAAFLSRLDAITDPAAADWPPVTNLTEK